MIPQEELDRFVLTYTEALACAGEGRAVRGYLLLKEGLRSVQESSDPWKGALQELWLSGLRRLQEQYPADWYPVAE